VTNVPIYVQGVLRALFANVADVAVVFSSVTTFILIALECVTIITEKGGVVVIHSVAPFVTRTGPRLIGVKSARSGSVWIGRVVVATECLMNMWQRRRNEMPGWKMKFVGVCFQTDISFNGRGSRAWSRLLKRQRSQMSLSIHV
jgi:hypothetical protein